MGGMDGFVGEAGDCDVKCLLYWSGKTGFGQRKVGKFLNQAPCNNPVHGYFVEKLYKIEINQAI